MIRPVPTHQRIAVGAAIAFGLTLAWTSPGVSKDPLTTGGSIHQLVESRPQGRTCTGVRIDLSHLAFKPRIAPGEIDVRDDKHDADLRRMVAWSVSPNGKRLTIRLTNPSSDFGTGNSIRVCLERA